MEGARMSAAIPKPRLSVERVAKSFPTASGDSFEALSDIRLEIAAEEFVSLLGPSGCGKSTLLEIIAGLQPATSGRVLMDGTPIVRPGPERAVVFQHFALFPWRTVSANVEFPMEMARVPKAERRSRAQGYLSMVGLEAFGDRHVWQLSGGMQQRVALARAMACTPEVLLMDEPFSGADAITRELLQAQLIKLHKATRKTVLFVTHSVDEAIGLSDRIVVMGTRPGRIVSIFSLDDGLRAQPGEMAKLRASIWDLLRKEILPLGEGEDSREAISNLN
jgi:NitT/TauT family transport system ATP-binding protein